MRLRTIGLICTLVLGLFAAPLPVEAQQAGKVYRIGWLRSGKNDPTTNAPGVAFRQGLRELGYVEGQNLVIEYRYAERKPERRAEMAAELVRLKVDVIVITASSPMTRAAQRATRTIPIVMLGLLVDPVEAGFVDSLARPGGNITGMAQLDSKLYGKKLELLKEVSPQISRVAILWPGAQQRRSMKEVEAVGRALGIQIQSLIVVRPGHLERAFSAILHTDRAQPRKSPGGLLVARTGLINRHRARIIEFAAKRRLPAIYATRRFAREGGLMHYGADTAELRRRAATYVDKILKGAKPADLPVEQPKKFRLVINLKTAKALGLTIPPEVLIQATQVIK